MIPPSSRAVDRWSLPAGTRLLALDDADCLVLEKRDAPAPPSEAARVLRKLASVASGDSLFFLNTANRVEASVDFYGPALVRIKDFSSIRSVMMGPGISRRLGTWKRERRHAEGFWSVIFEDGGTADNTLRKSLEQQIFDPWVKHASELVHVPGNHDAWVTEARLFSSLARYNRELRRIVSAQLGLLDGRGLLSSQDIESLFAPDVVLMTGDLAIQIEAKIDRLADIQDELARVLSSQPSRQGKGAPKTASDVITKIEKATQVVDELSSSLSSVTSEATASAAITRKTQATESDPIRNAIDLRERLTSSVKMVDAATWAQWRGARSKNPSAALGKYKNQARLFAVRAGNRDLYPAFQFSENGEPLPIIQEILKVVPTEAQGWSLLSWFEAKNVLLRGRRPSALLSSEPRAVLEAADRFYSRDD